MYKEASRLVNSSREWGGRAIEFAPFASRFDPNNDKILQKKKKKKKNHYPTLGTVRNFFNS